MTHIIPTGKNCRSRQPAEKSGDRFDSAVTKFKVTGEGRKASALIRRFEVPGCSARKM